MADSVDSIIQSLGLTPTVAPPTQDQKDYAPGVARAPLPAALQGKPTPPPTAGTIYKAAETVDPTGIIKSTRQLGTEVGHQVKGAAEGVYETAKTLGGASQAIDPFSLKSGKERKESLKKAGSAATGIVTGPVNALKGKPQEGYPEESRPQGVERATDAVDLVFGGDPGRARMLGKEGNTPGAIAAYATGPLLLKGAGKVVEELRPTTKPPFGPQPKSSVPALRENIPPTASATAERTMRILRPGQYLPNAYERVKKLTSVIGTSDKVNVPEALKVVMPELDKTAQTLAIPPKGVVATEGITERPGTGKGVTPTETLNNLMETTMGRLEGEYQGILGPARSQLVSTDPIADAIAAQKTPGLIDLAAAAPDSEAAKTVKYLNETEAAFRGKMLPLGSLDDLRQYYYTASRAGEAGRVAARSNEAVMADTATEAGLRNVIYDDLETRARAAGKDPGFIRDLKRKQANMYSLLDLGKQNATAYINQDSIKRGFDWLQNQNFTMAAHPPAGKLVGSLHGLGKKLAGDPESLPEAELRVRKSFAQKGVPNSKTGKAAQGVVNTAKPIAATAAAGSIPKRTPPPVTVRMRDASGASYDIPRDRVDEAKKDGLSVIQ